jgi:hypothetical protein
MKTNKRTHKISPPLTSTAQSPFTNGCWPIRTRPPAVSTSEDTATATSSHTENNDNTPPHQDEHHHANSFLKPGNILLKCSGSDIQLSKTAHVPPNFVTGRGRFLFLLPGLLSLQRPPPSPPNEDHLNDGTVNRTNDALVSLFSNSSSGMYTLGNIQKLDTEEPILELSLMGDGEKHGYGGKRLVFQGKKVKTCGRYLVLSCKTSGAVHCRNVFEELVVFGGEHEVVEESGEQVVDVNHETEENEPQEEEEEQNQLDDDSVRVVEEEENKDSANISKNNEDTKEQLFYHYGGSERAVDGGRPVRGIKRKKSLSTVVSMDIGSKRVNTSSSSSSSITRTGKTIRKSGVSQQQQDATNVIDLHSEEEEEEEEEEDNDNFEMNSPVPTTTRTRYVRKSATKRVKYTFEEEEEEEEQKEEQDQGQNSEESEEEECSVAFDSPQQSRKNPPQKGKKEQHGDVTVKKDQITRGATKKQSDVTRTKRNIILSKNTKAEKELTALSTSSPAFRKRRKSPKKTSSASKSLDGIMMNDDEDFIFVD